MVKGLLRFLNRETSSLHEAAYLLGFFAVLSQFLALIRDRLLAHIFGASTTLDLYYAAFRIPDFIFVAVGSLVSISVLVPFLIEKIKLGREEERKFINSIFSFFSLVIFTVAAVAFFLVPYITEAIFPGFADHEVRELVTLTRILLLSPIFLGFSNLLGSLTQVYNRFSIYAISPLLYNVGIILGIIFLNPIFGIKGVVYGVVIGAVLHALIQVPFIAKIGLLPSLPRRIDTNTILRVVRLSFPRTLTLSLTHISILFLISLASFMERGSISVFNFSINLQAVPLTIIGVSYSLAAFPTLSRLFSEKNIKQFINQMAITTRHVIFWSMPIVAMFVVLRAQIVRVLLGSGQFDWTATRLTAAALALFIISTIFQSLLLLFIRAFYSAGHTMKPLLINLFSSAFLVCVSYGLVKMFYAYPTFQFFVSALFKVEDLPGNVVLMLPLGYTVGTIVNGLIHWCVFERHFRGYTRQVLKSAFHSMSAAVIMGLLTYLGLVVFGQIFALNTLVGVFLQGFLAGLVGIIAWILVLAMLDSVELKEVAATLERRFWKAPIVGPDAEVSQL